MKDYRQKRSAHLEIINILKEQYTKTEYKKKEVIYTGVKKAICCWMFY